MEPEIRFCTSADGAEIGYVKMGEGPVFVSVTPWSGDFEAAWDYPGGREFITMLAQRGTYITFDRRGTGLSQRDVSDWSFEAHLADLTAVIEREGLGTFDLWGGYEASAVAVMYAVSHPEKVNHLVLLGPYARGRDIRSPESVKSMADLARSGRGGWSIARRAIVGHNLPSGPPDAMEWLQRWLRTAAPETFAEFVHSELELDITDLLPKIAVPTLILHRRGVKSVPLAAVRSAAARVKGARLVLLDGDAAFPWVEPQQLLKPVIEFIDGERAEGTTRDEGGGDLRTVLFTDLVGHTEMMSRLGDQRGRDVLREHERITREVLKANGGTEVKTMGDGFMASFGSVTKAVECAIALQRAFAGRIAVGAPLGDGGGAGGAALNDAAMQKAIGERNRGVGQGAVRQRAYAPTEPLSVRVGLNAGEPIEEDGDLFGATVILASRIAAKAGAGEILVPDTVRGLLSGKNFLFSDRGEFVPKG
ncbi:MAG: adenylate/guanylate cyclase domain-containing protein, partial [Chloroflexota bacterium]